MARNKYPEETVQKILDVSYHLFMTKGYEKTSIQDIVDHLGMSKGAIYHHFKSKEDILLRLCDQVYHDDAWFDDIQNDPGSTALDKLRGIFLYQLQDENKVAMDIVTMPMIYNSRMILESIKSAVQDVAPLLKTLIEQGNRDGSMHAKDPREASEIMILLINLWINPGLFPVERDRFLDKVRVYQHLMLDALGVPLFDETLTQAALHYYDAVTAEQHGT